MAGLGNSGHYFDAAFPMSLQCSADIGDARGAADGILELLDPMHAFGIATDAASYSVQRGSFIAVLENQIEVPLDDAEPLLPRRIRQVDTVTQLGLNMPEQPRLAKHAAGEHDAAAFRLCHHLYGVGGAPDIAVADDGNRLHRGDHRGDAFVPHATIEHLLGRSSMYRDCRDADLLESSGKVRSDDVLVIPAEPNLGGDRRAGPAGHGFYHPFGKPHGCLDISQQQRSAMLLGDLVDRAAHVDVHHLRTVIDCPQPGFGQGVAAVAVDLHAQRRISIARLDQFHRLGRFSQQAVHVDQIRAGQSHSAEFTAQQSKRQVTVAGHGGQQGVGFKLDRADRQHAIIVRTLADIPKNPWLKSSMQVPCAAAWPWPQR